MSSRLDDGASPTTGDAPAQEEGFYTVECILAEKWQNAWDLEPFGPGTKYLTKWETYPLAESKHFIFVFHGSVPPSVKQGTWEPAENFCHQNEDDEDREPEDEQAPTALDLWNRKKAKTSKLEFRRLCEKNIAEYKKALEEAEDDKARAEAIRGEDVVASRSRERSSQQQAPPPEVAPADSRRLSDLSMQNSTADNTGLFVRQPPKARKPLVMQSDSSSSEGELTDDSMMAEMTTTLRKKKRRSSTGVEGSSTERRSTRKLAQPPRASLKRAVTTPNPSSITKSNLATLVQNKELDRPSLPRATSGSRNEQIESTPTQRRASETGERTSAATGSDSVAHDSIQLGSTTPGAIKRSVSFATQPSTSKTASGAGKSSGIRIINEPKPKPVQIPALPKKLLYQTLRRQGAADKRSRREGTPDVAALSFVNAPPDAVISNPQAQRDDPYSRRELSHRRTVPEEPRDDEPPRQEPTDGNMPLAPWEVDKVPQVCYQWRLSNDCPKSAKECRFMHRHKDENGRDYPVGDMQGRIPGKFRRPPLTCPFWLNGLTGCKKSADDCQFAHRNTGWMKHSDPSMGDVRIDPDQQPKYDIMKSLAPDQRPKHNAMKSLRPKQLTCFYWSKGNCRFSEQDCAYQHKDTGIVANGPHIAHQRLSPAPDLQDDMETDDVGQPHMTDELTRTPSPRPTEQPQQFEFQLPPPPPPPPIKDAVKITCDQLQACGGSVCRLEFEDMFASNNGKEPISLLESRAFLMYHPDDHFEDLQIITRWLLLHHVQVASASYQGAWAVFKQQILQGGSGIIMAHPDVEYFTAFPGFGDILRKNVRLWSVGVQPGPEYDPALTDVAPVPRYERIEIFPVGGFIYITEEVFETRPQLALEIIKLFFAKIRNLKKLAGPLAPWQEVNDASLLWRLCVRPELMEYLFQQCEDHTIDLNAGNPDVQSCAKLYTLLAETNYIEQDNPEVPLSAVADKYPILSERRIIAECEPVDYFNTVARSKEAANLNMIQYYAGLQVDLRRDYRHFYVVHTEPKAKYVEKWKQEIQTIADVITPEQCVKEFMKDGQDSMFDFYERFMPAKESSKVAVTDGGATTRAG